MAQSVKYEHWLFWEVEFGYFLNFPFKAILLMNFQALVSVFNKMKANTISEEKLTLGPGY